MQCRDRLYAESYRIERHKEESYRKNRPCRLKLGEWAETLRHYKWRCAFCQGPFESLDHFIPVSKGGATWVGNVVPACLLGQTAKGNLLPQEVEAIPQEIIERVAHYLQRRPRAVSNKRIRKDPKLPLMDNTLRFVQKRETIYSLAHRL